jgi:vitamin B12 transporter
MKELGLIVVLFIAQQIQAQTKIYGTVKDQRGKAVIAVAITLKETYDGTVSDSAGKFSFKTYEKGSFIIEAKTIGYKIAEQKISLPSKEPLNINFILKEEISELKAVTVTAGSFAAGDKKRAATVLTATDMYTTAGSNADITAAIKTLPGAQQVGEQEGLFVRGGAAYETKEFIDGTLVNNPYNASVPNISSRSRFDPALFKGNVFSTGGYSALYGQALSSAFILESIDIPERSEAQISASPLFIGGHMQHVAAGKKSSWGGGYEYVNVGLYYKAVKQTPDYFTVPEVHNADFNYRAQTKNGGMIKYYSAFGYGKLGLRRPNIDSNGLKNSYALNNTNWYNNLSWKENVGYGWKMSLGLSFSTNTDNINSQIQDGFNQPVFTGISYIDSLNYLVKVKQDLYQAKAVFEKRLFGISKIRTGGEYWYSNAVTDINTHNFNRSVVLNDNLISLFTEAELVITNDVALTAGLRFENSSLIKTSNIAPRIALAYKTGKNAQMSLAYGTFYQKPENNLLQYNTGLGFSKATHYLINYIKSNNKYTFRLEGFYKQYESLVTIYPVYANTGDGYAKGIELFWRDRSTFKGIEYWVSYSYLDTKRQFLNYPEPLQPGFATPHTLNVVAKRFITNWKAGYSFTYSYATGRPYYFMYPSGNKYVIGDQGTTKSYHNLDFSVYYLPQLGKSNPKSSWLFFASIKNLLNTKNIYNYEYSHNGLNKVAIVPPASQTFFVGVFLTLGVDRTDDIINNNL